MTREKQNESDSAFASSIYQDGLKHALGDVLSGTRLGKSKEDFERELLWTQNELRKMQKAKNLIEIAYESGQLEVLRRFCQREMTQIPLYFHPHKLLPSRRYIKG